MPKIRQEIKDWFDYPDDPYHGRALIRLPKPGEQESIKEKSRELVVKEFRQETVALRTSGVKESLAVAAFVDWENFISADGEQMRCTEANVRLMCKEDGFLPWLDECLSELEKRRKAQTEAELKN